MGNETTRPPAEISDLTSHPSRLTPHASRSYPALDALLLLTALSLAMHPLVDPDFGWHLRAGLDLAANGWRMPATDPYSHTVPDWPWVEHAWLADGIIGLIYTGLGAIGPLTLIVVFAIVTAGAFLLAASLAPADRTHRLLAVAIALYPALPFLGVRTQMITLLGLAVVLWLSKWYLAGHRASLWMLPLVFLLWGNLHGGFTGGLFLLALIIAAEVLKALGLALCPSSLRGRVTARIQEPCLSWPAVAWLGGATACSALVTLVNPYGWRLHGEIYASLSDQFMIETLHEWQPLSLDTRAGFAYAAYLAALGLGLLIFCRRIQPTRWIITGVFAVLSVLHWRNIPFFLLVSVPLAAELLAAFTGRLTAVISRVANGIRHPRRWLLAVTVGMAMFAGTVGHDLIREAVFSGLAPAEYFRTTDYPIEAIEWIRAHPDRVGSRMYNDYGLGGFLLWWMPERKVFIDGRMPAWRVGNRWIFYDYVALNHWDPPALGVLEKYGVDWAIMESGSPLDWALARLGGWEEIYGDTKVAIYVRRDLSRRPDSS